MALTLRMIEGFETQGFERCTSIVGSPAISATVFGGEGVRSCFLAEAPASSNQFTIYPYEYQGTPSAGSKVVGFRWKLENNDGSYSTQTFVFGRNSSASTKFRLRLGNTGSNFYMALDDSALASVGTYTSQASDANWHYLEVAYSESATGTGKLYLDGTEVISGSGNFIADATDRVQFYNSSLADDGSFVDDIYFGEITSLTADPITQQGYDGFDIFICAGDTSSTEAGGTLDSGTMENTQEIPASDTNIAGFADAVTSGNTERAAPDAIAVQTNLTGSVTDIDEDPDSPDANWLTASGSSTLRVTFPTPTGTPDTGAGVQNFRVLMRKNATGPAPSSGTEDVTPDSLITQTGLTGAITLIDDDPDSPDGDTNWTGDNGWMTSSASNSVLVVSMTDPTNGGDIDDTTDAQVIKVFLRKDASGGGDPTFTLAVYDGASLHETLATDVAVTTAGTLFSYNWTSSGLSSPNNVRVNLTCTKGGGGPNERNVEVDAIRWEMAYSTGASETQPGYSIQLYENGSQVVAVTPVTGNLTDAGGDTVVALTWDATELGTADGSLVECYITQTSGADRYIEFGAVEWNVTYSTSGSTVSRRIEADGTGSFTGPSTGRTLDGAILGAEYFLRQRYSGSGSTLTGYEQYGNDVDGVTLDTVDNLTAAWANQFYFRASTDGFVPTDAQDSVLGIYRNSTNDVGVDVSEHLVQIAYAPTASGDIIVTATTEAVQVTENSATVNKSREVSCTTEVLQVTENSATVNQLRGVSGSTEAVTLTENNAAVDKQRGVAGITEAVVITENDATVVAIGSTPLNVNCTTEVVTVTESNAAINKTRDVYAVGTIDTGYVSGVQSAGSWTNASNAVDGSTGTYAYATASAELRLQYNSSGLHTETMLGAEIRAYVQAVGHSGDPFYVPWVAPNTIALLSIDSEYATAKWTPWVTASAPTLGWNDHDWMYYCSIRPNYPATASGEFRVFKVEIRGYFAEGASVTTSTASLNVTRSALATTEVVTVTENNANLNITRNVSGVTEVVTATENNASVTRGIAVAAATEAVTVTENNASLNVTRGVTGVTEVVTVTENNATINASLYITGATQSVLVGRLPWTFDTTHFTFDDNVVHTMDGWHRDAIVNAARGAIGITESVTLAENTASINLTRGVTGVTEIVVVAENDATVGMPRGVVGATEVVTVTENNASLNVERGVIGVTEVVTVTETPASIGGSLPINAITEVVTVTENNASLNITRGVNASTEVVAVTENNAAVNKPKAVSGVTEIVTVTENNAAVGRSRAVSGVTEIVSVTENPATVNQARGVAGASEAVTLTENNASLNISRGVAGVTEVVVVTETPASIGGSLTISASTELVTVTENPASLNVARGVTAATEQVTVTENAASLNKARGVTGATEIITVTENDATVQAGALQWIVTGVTETVNVSANSATIVYFLRHVPNQDAGWVQITSGADTWNNITPSQAGGWVEITPNEPDDWVEGSIIN